MNKKVKIVLAILVLLLGLKLYSSLEMHFPFNPYVDTIFAKDFAWEKFNRVELGMTQEQVEAILGKPLDKHNYGSNNPNYICWRYSTDGKLWPYADFSYYLVQTCFKNGVVESKPVTEFNN